ncbi:MAG: VTT domain-containing protein [Deltaproteobacteria bacterium]
MFCALLFLFLEHHTVVRMLAQAKALLHDSDRLFGISSLFGKAVQARLAHTSGYRRFNHLVAKGDFVIPFLLFLLPGFPKDSLSYLLGLSRMPWRVFLFIAAIGRIPGTLMLSLQGAQVFERDFFTLFLLLVGSLLFFLPFYLNRHRLVAWLERLGRRRQGSEVITTSSFSGPDDRL